MNYNDIIKALECCTKTRKIGDCKAMGCPALTPHGCSYYLRMGDDFAGEFFVELIKDSLNLHYRQKAEIEELQKEVMIQICKIEEERQKAVKEFAKRLDETKIKIGNDYFIYADNIQTIKKEIAGEKE